MIKECRQNEKKFEIVYLQYPLTDDMRPDGTPVCKAMDYKAALDPLLKASADENLTKLRGVFINKNNISAKRSLWDPETKKFPIEFVEKRKQNIAVSHFWTELKPAYDNFLPVYDKNSRCIVAFKQV